MNSFAFALERHKRLRGVLGAVLAGAALWVGGTLFLPGAYDWVHSYRPAALAWLEGRDPYAEAFYNPPWILPLIAPMAVLPEEVGRALYAVISMAAFAYAIHRLGAGVFGISAFIVSLPVLNSVYYANVDWLVVLGLVLAPRWGLLLLAVKPQLGALVALFWLARAYRQGGWKIVLRTLTPLVVAGLLSILMFGLWPLKAARLSSVWWNTSFWPHSIPFGILLAVMAWKRRRDEWAMLGTLFLSPYVGGTSWAGGMTAFAKSQWLMVGVSVGLWAIAIWLLFFQS